MFDSGKIKMAYCYNFKLMFFLYAIISCKYSITSAASSTSGSTTITTSVSTQSTASSTLETTMISSPTSSPVDTISTPHSTSIFPSTSPTTTATLTSVSTTLSPSVSTTTSSPTSSPPTATLTSGTIEPSSSTSPTTTVTSTPEPTTSSSSASNKISSTSDTTKLSSPILTPAATSSSDTAFSSSTALTTTSTSTSESTTLSLSASTTTRASSTSESTKFSSPSLPQTTTASTSDTRALSSSTSLTTISTSMSESTTLSLSASTTTSSSTSENTTISSPTSEITTPSSPTSPATTATSTFKSTTISLPPNSIVVDLGSHTLGLNFSIRVNLTFNDEYKNKTSPGFAKLAADFREQLTPIYKNTSWFKYIQINEFRNGSVDANYSVIVSAATSLKDIMAYIDDTVIVQLKNLSIRGGDVDDTYIEMTMQNELDALESLSICEHSTPRPCPYGFNCSNWISGSVLCSDRCDSKVCVHGTCYIDHQNEIIPKCRCPIDDDGYVYSGDRCEHKSLSTLIIITSAVGGGVLIAAFFIVCLICMKMGRNTEQLENIPLDNLPNYSKNFPRDSTYQPHYGYDLPMGRRKSIESRDLEAIPRYIPDSDDGQENEGFFYQESVTPSGDYVSNPIREKHIYDYIGANTKFEIRRPQFR